MIILDTLPTRWIRQMKKSLQILQNLANSVNQQQAMNWKDDPSFDGKPGWSILEVFCHLADYDEIFYQRAQKILNEEAPQLPAYDHELLAQTHAYQEQSLLAVIARLTESRQRFAAFFEALPVPAWQRIGYHPESGEFSLYHSAAQVVGHDLDHIEQISRTIAQNRK